MVSHIPPQPLRDSSMLPGPEGTRTHPLFQALCSLMMRVPLETHTHPSLQVPHRMVLADDKKVSSSSSFWEAGRLVLDDHKKVSAHDSLVLAYSLAFWLAACTQRGEDRRGF